MEGFRDRIWKYSQNKRSRLVLALDVERAQRESRQQMLARTLEIVGKLGGELAAIKVNFQLLFPMTVEDEMVHVARKAHEENCMVIADLKLNDVGHTNRFAAGALFDAGIDAIITNPIAGWAGGLQPVFECARSCGGGVLCLCYPSHDGAREFYGLSVVDSEGRKSRLFKLMVQRAVSWGADGLVVGATHPAIVKEVRHLTEGSSPIYSPGVGTQGGEITAAFRAGTTYAIAGRSVLTARDPLKEARHLKERINMCLSE